MRIAVAHHWFVTKGGGERVAECIAALFPRAEICTLVQSPAGTPGSLAGRRWHTSLLQRWALARENHRHFLPLYPLAAQSIDAREFDLILSSDSGPIKGLKMRRGTAAGKRTERSVPGHGGARQICYCHSPMRYLWDGFEEYRAAMGRLTGTAFALAAPRVREWDRESAAQVDWFLANSAYVQGRIARCYRRESTVIHPPIDLHRAAAVAAEPPGDHYLCAGRLVSYKRTDILIEACRRMGRKLRVAGAGPEMDRLQALAGGDPLIEFTGELPTAELWREFARCRALLFAADEDFGMIPLEAQACGRPVIAYGHGGSLETVRAFDGQAFRTGTYFLQQTPEAVMEALREWDGMEARFAPEHARQWAATFATPRFLEQYRTFVLEHVPEAASEAVTVEQAMQSMKALEAAESSEAVA